jgi:hypothetical protein
MLEHCSASHACRADSTESEFDQACQSTSASATVASGVEASSTEEGKVAFNEVMNGDQGYGVPACP